MTVRLRLKKLGRKHRPFFRLCAMDVRSPRDGKVIEELGYYDPMVKESDARAVLNGPRIDYWLGVGAQPSDKAQVLIKKYGTNGTHLQQQQEAFDRLKIRPSAPEPVVIPRAAPESEQAAAEAETPTSPDAEAEAGGGESSAEAAANDDSSGDGTEEGSSNAQ